MATADISAGGAHSQPGPEPVETDKQAGPAAQEFRGELFSHFNALEHHVRSEIQKLEDVIKALQEENSVLRSQCVIDPPQDNHRRQKSVAFEEPSKNGSISKDGISETLSHQPAHSLHDATASREASRDEWATNLKDRTARYTVHNVSKSAVLYKKQGIASRIVKSGFFEYFTLIVVTVNAIWIGFDMDYNQKSIREADLGFQIGEFTFSTMFTVEILLRFAAFKNKQAGFLDKWFVFDSAVTFLMWVDIIVSFAFEESGGGIMSTFRLFRLMRLTRVTKLANVLPEFMTLMKGIVAGIRSVSIAVAVLIGITYTFAILLRAMSFETQAESVFTSVPHSMYILLQQGMGPDNVELMDELGRARWYLAFVFAGFLFLSAITIMNMLIGILCEVMGSVTAAEKETSALAQMGEKLQFILNKIDENYDHRVSREEFQSMLDHPEAISTLQEVGVDVYALVDDIDSIFEHNFEGKLRFKEFLEVIMSFRPTNAAVIRSISGLRRQMRFNSTHINARLDNLELGSRTQVNNGNQVMQMSRQTTPETAVTQPANESPTSPETAVTKNEVSPSAPTEETLDARGERTFIWDCMRV